MKFPLLIGFLLICCTSYSQNQITIGETETLHSEILKEDRVLEIHLPKGYEASDKTFPVLYLLDSPYNFTHAVGSVEYLHFRTCSRDFTAKT